ncbi:hypothetical protein K438DRAFT_1997695 [Mycena galopus ATCC 62051]|nr:hypothetical protein K438DRAFT_1997695 [Mycena galopus ATCC 62051]
MVLAHTLLYRIVLAGLLVQDPFHRIAGFTNSMSTDLHVYYRTTMDKLSGWNLQLWVNFPAATSVFAAVTFNFGPRTITYPHLDFANLAWGWCAIIALGRFDPDKGSHLILWDLKLVIRFPPGSTILIPSALIRHSNTSVQVNETRYSFAQYTSAGIFRFVENGLRSDEDVYSGSLSEADHTARVVARQNRWLEGLKMYRRWGEPKA